MELDELRKKIDVCDKKIVEALVERFEIVGKIGEYKKQNNIPIVNKDREKIVIDKVKSLSENRIPDVVIEKIYAAIISSAVLLENDL
ncbi:MAG: chorismate mutase [Rickettsiales bacterium]|jgi:chorismate mutase|nr:chorismate mutase [Rickettsiales bacterium]